MSNSTHKKPVKRRKVFFISGYDPKGPGWYHGLFAREAQKQAKLSGMDIDVGKRQNVNPEQSSWAIKAQDGEINVASDYVFLRWDDIVRKSWTRGTATMLGVIFRNFYHYLGNGILRRLLGTSWNTFNAAFYPTAFVLLTILVGLIIGSSLGALFSLSGFLRLLITIGAAAVFTAIALPILDRKFVIYWMSRIFAFNLKQGMRQVPELDTRSDRFALIVLEAINSEKYDEVLVVGHSTGAQLAVTVLAKALQIDPDFGSKKTKVSFLTLGGSIAMLAWVEGADWFCDQLESVANHPDIDWIDFSATQDGASFTLFDPIEGSGLKHHDPQNKKPKLLSIKMFQLFSKSRFKKVRRDWNKIHFQYLCSSELVGDYDYFLITAGSKTLTERFKHRKTTRDFSKYRIKWLHQPVPPRRTKITTEPNSKG